MLKEDKRIENPVEEPQTQDANASVTVTNTPPIQFKRNEFGLYEHVNYVFNEDGSVNWRKMVKPEFLVVNKDSFERRNQVPPSSTEGLEDKDLIILLGGIKELAKIRGYNSVTHYPLAITDTYVAVRSSINWIPNYETDGRQISFEAWGDAHSGNVSSFVRPYLASVAENRGFSRAVRNFLGINIVSQEELGANSKEVTDSTTGKPIEGLKRLLEANGISFEAFLNRMVKEQFPGADKWTGFDDIPVECTFELIEKTNKRIEEKKNQTKK